MRIFRGAFLLLERGSGVAPPERFAPAIELRLLGSERGEHRERVDFQIDTGAEMTTLYSRDARRVLGEALGRINFDDHPNRVITLGAGGEEIVAVRMDLSLTLYDDVDTPERISDSVLVAKPNPDDLYDPDAGRGNWDTPSLLGRDQLLNFDLFVSARSDTVYLSLPDS